MGADVKREWSRSVEIVRWTLLALALVLLATAGWIRFRFGGVSVDQILLNLPTADAGGAGNERLIVEAALLCLGVPLLIVGLALLGARFSPRAAEPPSRRALVAVMIAFAVSLGVMLEVAGVPEYASAVLGNRSISPYYLRPAITGSPSGPHNLVTIYLESGENTFSDESLFGENLLSDLDGATSGWARYDGLRQYPGGGWTMSGLVATECGIPLRSRLLVDGMNLNNFGEGVASYLPGATCLGDLLSAEGYTNVFLGGAHTRFGGKDTFFSSHGYDQVKGLADWEADGESRSEISVWGLSDRRLFARARQTVDALHEAGEPFNLTLLTLDTHEPGGVFPSCTTTDDVAMKTATRCSMQAVAGFLDHLRAKGYLADTVVQIMGDHLKATSEGSSFRDELEPTPDRTIIYRLWSPEPVTFSRERADQLSVLPTTLELLGFRPEAGRAGLGVSFVSPHPLKGTVVDLPEADYRAVVTAPSAEIYRAFWGEQ